MPSIAGGKPRRGRRGDVGNSKPSCGRSVEDRQSSETHYHGSDQPFVACRKSRPLARQAAKGGGQSSSSKRAPVPRPIGGERLDKPSAGARARGPPLASRSFGGRASRRVGDNYGNLAGWRDSVTVKRGASARGAGDICPLLPFHLRALCLFFSLSPSFFRSLRGVCARARLPRCKDPASYLALSQSSSFGGDLRPLGSPTSLPVLRRQLPRALA